MAGKLIAALVLSLCVSLGASGTTITVAGNSDDRQISESSMPWIGQPEARVGVGSTEGSCAVLVFELPLLPTGETVDTADLAFSVTGGNNWNALFEKGLDLYGLRISQSPTVKQTDYYKGAYNGDTTEATAIQPFIVYESEALNQGAPGELGRHDTDAAGEAALGAWIQGLYDSGSYQASVANYAFVRLSARDDLTSNYRYWSVATANHSSECDRPVLTIETTAAAPVVPEPITMTALLTALTGLGAYGRRRI